MRSSVSKNGRILVVDDQVANRKLLADLVAREGFEAVVAAGGAEALEVLSRESIDLVLLDLMMPGVDGMGVLAELRERGALPGLPVVVVTAHDDRDARIAALTAGATDFLAKPIDRVEVACRVRALIELKRLRERVEANLHEAERLVVERTAALREEVEERKRKSAELEEANQRLQSLHTLKTDFLAFVSHELRTPLTALAVVGMLDPEGDPKEQAELLDIMRIGYERLHAFISGALEYFAWLSVERVASTTITDLSTLVRGAAGEVPELASPGVDFQFSCTDAACPVRAEPSDLTQVLRILLDNALKFSPDEKVIRIELECAGATARLRVSDRGVGLTPESMRGLFQPYQVIDVAHHSKGTGLNLAIARAILTAHQGDIRVESPGPGLGSTFIAELPIHRPTAAP